MKMTRLQTSLRACSLRPSHIFYLKVEIAATSGTVRRRGAEAEAARANGLYVTLPGEAFQPQSELHGR
jgi:hypothetical protein